MGLAGILKPWKSFAFCINRFELFFLLQFYSQFTQKPNATVDSSYVAELDIGNYNIPKEGDNQLGHIGYSTERFYSESGKPNVPQRTIWFPVTKTWFDLASDLEVRKKKRDFSPFFWEEIEVFFFW